MAHTVIFAIVMADVCMVVLEQVSLGAKICCVFKLSKRTGKIFKTICLHTNSIASAQFCSVL